MPKGFAPHRVVTRDENEKIIRDEHFESFAQAEPIWQDRCAVCPQGQSVTLQHSARVIRRWDGVV